MENETEIIEIEDEAPVMKNGFDAVPIHFRPGKTGTKRIKLVIPGIEPPLLFAEVSGDHADNLKFEIIAQEDIESNDDTPMGEELEIDEDAAVITVESSKEQAAQIESDETEARELNEEMEDDVKAMDNILEELPEKKSEADVEDEAPEEEDEIPTDDAEEPEVEEEEEVQDEPASDEIAGYLIAKEEDQQPQWIEVKAMEGETDMEAVNRVAEDNPDYKPGTLEDVERLNDNKPLYGKDN